MGFFDTGIKEIDSSSAYQLDARSKLFMVLVYSVSLFFCNSWSSTLAQLFILIAVIVFCKVDASKVLRYGSVVYVIVVITVICNCFTFDGDAVSFSLSGLSSGMLIGLRILLLFWMSFIFCLTTPMEQMSAALSSILMPLRHLHVPVDDVAMTLCLAIRFIPETADEFAHVKEAQWSRGASFDEGGLIVRLKAHVLIILPVIVNLFRRSEKLATSMDCRCYGLSASKRGNLYSGRLGCIDLIVCLLFAGICIAVAMFL